MGVKARLSSSFQMLLPAFLEKHPFPPCMLLPVVHTDELNSCCSIEVCCLTECEFGISRLGRADRGQLYHDRQG